MRRLTKKEDARRHERSHMAELAAKALQQVSVTMQRSAVVRLAAGTA